MIDSKFCEVLGVKMNIDKNNAYIAVRLLIEYVRKNEVAWQMRDSLVEFSRAEGYELAEEENEEYEVKNSEMLAFLANASECKVFILETDKCEGFENLLEWSNDNDLLILVDKELLLCIAPCDKEQVLATVA